MLIRRKGPKEVVSAFAGAQPKGISKRSDHFAYLADKVFIPYGVKDKAREDYSANLLINDTNREFAQVVSEVGASGAYTSAYTYGTERLTYDHLNKTQTYLTDGRGSVTELVSAGSNIDARYSYDALGTPSVTGKTYNPYTYNAEYTDATTGLQYLRARYLDFSTSRFVTQDTYLGDIVNPLTQNLYSYVSNNPANLIDPTGHFSVSGLINSAVNAVKSVATKVVNAVKSAVNTVVSAVKGVVNKITGAVQTAVSYGKAAVSAGKKAVSAGIAYAQTTAQKAVAAAAQKKAAIQAKAAKAIAEFRRKMCEPSAPKASGTQIASTNFDPSTVSQKADSINWDLVGDGFAESLLAGISLYDGIMIMGVGGKLVGGAIAGEVYTVGAATVPAGVVAAAGSAVFVIGAGSAVSGGIGLYSGVQKMVYGLKGEDAVPESKLTNNPYFIIIDSVFNAAAGAIP